MKTLLFFLIGIIVLILIAILVPQITHQQEITALHEELESYINSDQYDAAINVYKKLAEKEKTNEYDDEIKALTVKTTVQMADKFISNEDYGTAIKLYGLLSEKYPDLKAIIDMKKESINSMIKRVAIEVSGVDYENALEYYEKGDYESALYQFKKVIEDDVDHYSDALAKIEELNGILFKVYYDRAVAAYKQKDYDTALENINLALEHKDDENARELQATYEKAIRDQEAVLALVKAKEKMRTPELGIGDIAIACEVYKVTRTFDAGYTTYTAAENGIFLWLMILAGNAGTDTEHVNPNDFTLSTPKGYTVNPDTDTTYSLNNYFDAIDLPSKGSTAGLLIFHITKEDYYTLHYQGFYSSVDKKVVVSQ